MQIHMTTFAGRSRQYLHDTLRSLFDSEWGDTRRQVSLILGSADESHLGPYAAHPLVRIVPWDVETNPILRWNCTLNKIRALRWGADEPTLICEDDILFPPTWLSAVKAAVAELEDEDYILSLTAAKPELDKARLLTGKHLVKRYPTYVLQGAQALFYPSKVLRNRVADFLQQHLTRSNGDELIGRFARSHAALYATKDPLVDHVGFVSCFHEKSGAA